MTLGACMRLCSSFLLFRTPQHLDALHTDQPAPAKFHVSKRNLGVSDMVSLCINIFQRSTLTDRDTKEGDKKKENRKSHL